MRVGEGGGEGVATPYTNKCGSVRPWRLHGSDEWCSSRGSIGWQPGAQSRENGAPYLKHEGMRADDPEESF